MQRRNHGNQHWMTKSGTTIRAGVFGVNDGLVSNASLILGVAGASTHTSLIILAGIAGLASGALSMAAGEYISMRSQRELFENQITLVGNELQQNPTEKLAELQSIYVRKGLSAIDAKQLAEKIFLNKTTALHTLAVEELGLNPDELGSPWTAAISSLICFAIGAFIPVLPFFFNIGILSLWISIAISGLSLFIVGMVLCVFTGRNIIYSGIRMLAIGGFAGLATFLIGRAVGLNLS